MKYDIKKMDNGKFYIVEKETGLVLKSDISFLSATTYIRNLKKGSGFNGKSPNFFALQGKSTKV